MPEEIMARTPVQARRRALVAAALRVVAARGLHEASTRAIVAEAGMSLASFHYAFESRDQLIDRLITEVMENEEKAIIPSNPESLTLAELLNEGLMGYVANLRADPPHEQAMLELTQYALRTRRPLALAQYEQYNRLALAMLNLAAEHTGVTWSVPVSTVARLLIALTDGLTLSWLVDRDDPGLDAAVAAAATALASLAEPGADPETPAGDGS